MKRGTPPGPAHVVAAAMLDLLEELTPLCEDDWTGQLVLDAVRGTHAELARQLQGSTWRPRRAREGRMGPGPAGLRKADEAGTI